MQPAEPLDEGPAGGVRDVDQGSDVEDESVSATS